MNNKDKIQELKKQGPALILQQINEKIQEFSISAKKIRAIKQLQSGDFAIHAINEDETNKLRDDTT